MANTNLTLSIDENVLRLARKIALDRNTSVNEIIRNHLTELVSASLDPQQRLRKLEQVLRSSRYRIGGPITWKRDDLYERR